MVVQHNISAMTANRYYTNNNSALGKSMEKLSSGLAINRAGDNAAGLAVSEKMRAQISGLTQASKNAQDGISMVQTFEGALQETDSILQRMRSLAVQSANGSYADDVDRDAMQLEFDQLNDELNQIADTDYNGVVMLNGGQMADGVKAVDGKIDYSNKKAQIYDLTKNALQAKVDNAQANYNKAVKDYTSGKYDLSSNGLAPEWNTVDNRAYNTANADVLWAVAGIKDSDGHADTKAADTIEVTFESDGNGGWSVKSGTAYLNGEKVSDVTSNLKDGTNGLDIQNVRDTTSTDSTGYGGFKVGTKGVNNGVVRGGTAAMAAVDKATSGLGNVIFNDTNISKGSTITLVYTNGAETKSAPTNIGVNESSEMIDVNYAGASKPSVTVAKAARVVDANMDEDMESALTALEDAKIEWTYDATAGFATGDITVNGNSLSTTDPTKITDKDGNSVWAKMDADGLVSFYDNSACDDTNDLIATATLPNTANDTVDTSSTASRIESGTYSVEISVSSHKYAAASTQKLTAGDDPNLESSSKPYERMGTAQKAFEQASEDLKNFKKLNKDVAQDWEKIKEYYSSSQSSSGAAVSISDYVDGSKAKLTYSDTMSLQAGARSKDLVDFTFKYSTDLGGLKQNLNCSSRADGLNTATLSIQTQEDANKAIDKIDNALNKISMVRGTFGAIQNRLEHKISNIDTNTENLTAAESRIRDTQMDQEMMKFTSAQILSQASQSMLAQANSLPQGVLQLLG